MKRWLQSVGPSSICVSPPAYESLLRHSSAITNSSACQWFQTWMERLLNGLVCLAWPLQKVSAQLNFPQVTSFLRDGETAFRGFVCQCLSITVRARARWHGCGDINLACPSLTALFSRLFQAFPRAVREALHHAQEYAEALREPGELLRLRPARCQHRGLLRRPG